MSFDYTYKKHCFRDSLIVKCLFIILEVKGMSAMQSYFELKNEISRQVHKTSVDIVCSYTQNLLMTQFRCLRVSGALHVMCVEQTIRVM